MNDFKYSKMVFFFFLLVTGTLFAQTSADSTKKVLPDKMIEGVAVITHSISASLEAQNILDYMNWVEVPPGKDTYILVVCRSDRDDPLGVTYDSLEELSAAVEILRNQTAQRFHIYFYKFTKDSTLKQFYYDSYPVEGYLFRDLIR